MAIKLLLKAMAMLALAGCAAHIAKGDYQTALVANQLAVLILCNLLVF